MRIKNWSRCKWAQLGGLRHDGGMPRYARPAQGALLEAAIDVFGNRVRVSLLHFLHEHGPATRGEIAEALDVAGPTVYNHLRAIADHGVVMPDPPISENTRGVWTKWQICDHKLFELYVELGKQYGFIASQGESD
jgi:DNA-binding transcriptional ArsR family regulator